MHTTNHTEMPDSGAIRTVAPSPPTFTSRDPHFERYFWTTPYGYCNNNPLKYVDPTGMDWYQDADGNAVFNKNVNEKSQLGEGEKYIGKTASLDVCRKSAATANSNGDQSRFDPVSTI